MLREYRSIRPAYHPGGLLATTDIVVLAHGSVDAARQIRQAVTERSVAHRKADGMVPLRLDGGKRKDRRQQRKAKVAA